MSSLFDNDLVTVVTSAVGLVSTTVAVVVRDIGIMGATLAPFRSLVAHPRLARHTHIAVGVAIVGDTHNLTGTVEDVALSYFLSHHRCDFLSL